MVSFPFFLLNICTTAPLITSSFPFMNLNTLPTFQCFHFNPSTKILTASPTFILSAFLLVFILCDFLRLIKYFFYYFLQNLFMISFICLHFFAEFSAVFISVMSSSEDLLFCSSSNRLRQYKYAGVNTSSPSSS